MERIDLTKYRLNHLVKYKLSRNVIAKEAEIFYFPRKTKWENEMKALKWFYRDLMPEKVENIEFLNDHKLDLESIPALVVPETIVSYYGKDKGIVMPFIEHINLVDLLKNKEIDESVKLKYLKDVGKTLDEISLLRKYNSSFRNFALGDLHESNIIIDSQTGDAKIIDLDSAYTGPLIPASRYLTINSSLEDASLSCTNKYPVDEDDHFIPNEQTDLYCYHMMILNYLYGDNVANLTQEEFYYYLEYLYEIGANTDFLDSCLRLYVNQENINPKDFIEDLEKVVPLASKNIYEANYKKL